jgi:hypothetical protein
MADWNAFSAEALLPVTALEQHLAARPVQLCVERAMTGPLGRRQCFLDHREGAVEIARAGERLQDAPS